MSRSRKILISIAIFSVLAMGSVALLWRTGVLMKWAKTWVVRHYISRVAPHLPFEVEKVEFKEELTQLFRGNIERLAFVVRWGEWRLRFEGPIQFERNAKKNQATLHYPLEATIEPVGLPTARSSSITIDVWIRGSKNLMRLESAEIAVAESKFKFAPVGLEIEQPAFSLIWADNRLRLATGLKTLTWMPKQQPGQEERALSLSGFTFHSSGTMELSPLRLGNEFPFEAHAQSSEWLEGKTYVTIPLASLPMSGRVDLLEGALQSAMFHVGTNRAPYFSAAAKLKYDPAQKLQEALVDWRTGSIDVPTVFFAALKALHWDDQEPWDEIALRGGKIQAQGRAQIPFPFRREAIQANATIDLKGLRARWDENNLAIRDLDAHLPVSLERGLQGGLIHFESAFYKNIRAHLDPLSFSATSREHLFKDQVKLQVSVSKPPLSIEAVPLELGALSGEISYAGGKPRFKGRTSIELKQFDTQKIAPGLCLAPTRLPPATVTVTFPEVALTEDSFTPKGGIQVDLFNGNVFLGNLAVRDWGSRASELRFDATMGGIRLDKMSEWTGFGNIDGLLTGYSHDTVVRNGVPIHYDAQVRIAPLPGRNEAVFATEAMHNFIRLLGGASIDELPWFVNLFAFGPQVTLFGGFNVYYAGINAIARNSMIELHTLDDHGDPNHPPNPEFRAKSHFILRGRRVNIPLHAPRYPVVVETTAMTSFVKRVAGVLMPILKRNYANRKKENFDAPLPDCFPPEF